MVLTTEFMPEQVKEIVYNRFVDKVKLSLPAMLWKLPSPAANKVFSKSFMIYTQKKEPLN